MQVALKRKYPNIKIIMGAVEDATDLNIAVRQFEPEIIIHCAALKHVDTGEINPNAVIKANIIGSLNVIETAISCDVSYTVGISTDKACNPDNAYGYSKSLMERMFLTSNTVKTNFASQDLEILRSATDLFYLFGWVLKEKKNLYRIRTKT